MAGGTDYHEKAAHDEDVTKAVWRHLRALTWLQWACPCGGCGGGCGGGCEWAAALIA